METTYKRIFSGFGENLLSFLTYFGGLAVLASQAMKSLFARKFPLQATIEQCHFVGIKSLNLVNLIAVFTGMVLALQFAVGLGRFGLKLYIGQVIGLAIIRELGPVLTSLMLAARVGSGIAAELGSMVVTEQVMAIEALGANPIQKLVLPRLVATVLAAPLLTVIGNTVGIIGGMLITVMEASVTPRFYFDQIQKTVAINDFLSGVSKTIFFGFFIALIACYEGLKTRGGTVGVGKATTYAVVFSSVMIFVADFFLTKLFLIL